MEDLGMIALNFFSALSLKIFRLVFFSSKDIDL